MEWIKYFDKVFPRITKKGDKSFSDRFLEQTQKKGSLRFPKMLSESGSKRAEIEDELSKDDRDEIDRDFIDIERKFKMNRFGDNRQFASHLREKAKEAKSKALKKMYTAMAIKYEDSLGENNPKSPIERLASIKCVVDIPYKELRMELKSRIKKINTEITARNAKKGFKKADRDYEFRLPTGENNFHDPRVKKIIQEIRQYPKYKDILEARQAQEKRIKEWVDHLSSFNFDSRFKKLMLGTILQYDYKWMFKVDGKWVRPEKRIGKYTNDNFPPIDDIDIAVIARLDSIYTLYFSDKDSDKKKFEDSYDKVVRDAVEDGNVREVYYLVKEELESQRLDPNTVKVAENFVPTLEKFERFSVAEMNTTQEVNAEIERLSRYVKDSPEICLQEEREARNYLLGNREQGIRSQGDLYILNVPTRGRDRNGQTKLKNFPEVVIRVIRNRDGTESLDQFRIHGGDENQGIKPEYLDIAHDFVMQKKADGSYRFTNAQRLETTFLDAKMYHDIKNKVNAMKTGGPDLEPNELKFLYEVHRFVRSFEIVRHMNRPTWVLRSERLAILRKRSGKFPESMDFESDQVKRDYEKMFGVPLSYENKYELDFQVNYLKSGDGSVRTGNYYDLGKVFFTHGVPKIIGGDVMVPDNNFSVDWSKIESIAGVTLTDLDRDWLSNPENIEKVFPPDDDPRLVRVYQKD